MKYFQFAGIFAILLFVFNIPSSNAANFAVHGYTVTEYRDMSNDCGATRIDPMWQYQGMLLAMDIVVTPQTSDRFMALPGYGYDNPVNQDHYVGITRDTYGNVISINRGIAIIEEGTAPTFFVVAIYDTPYSRPWTLSIYDFSYPNIYDVDEILATYPFIDSYTFDPADYLPSCARLPYIGTDGNGNNLPINEGNSENEVAVYNATDDNGDPSLHIYNINDEGNGTLALAITQDIIAPYIDNPPAENTELLTSADGKVTLYILDTGELQINSGPDAEGKIHVIILDGIPPTNIYGYVIDPIDFP